MKAIVLLGFILNLVHFCDIALGAHEDNDQIDREIALKQMGSALREDALEFQALINDNQELLDQTYTQMDFTEDQEQIAQIHAITKMEESLEKDSIEFKAMLEGNEEDLEEINFRLEHFKKNQGWFFDNTAVAIDSDFSDDSLEEIHKKSAIAWYLRDLSDKEESLGLNPHIQLIVLSDHFSGIDEDGIIHVDSSKAPHEILEFLQHINHGEKVKETIKKELSIDLREDENSPARRRLELEKLNPIISILKNYANYLKTELPRSRKAMENAFDEGRSRTAEEVDSNPIIIESVIDSESSEGGYKEIDLTK